MVRNVFYETTNTQKISIAASVTTRLLPPVAHHIEHEAEDANDPREKQDPNMNCYESLTEKIKGDLNFHSYSPLSLSASSRSDFCNETIPDTSTRHLRFHRQSIKPAYSELQSRSILVRGVNGIDFSSDRFGRQMASRLITCYAYPIPRMRT